MADFIEHKVQDLYLEHPIHLYEDYFEPACSTCFTSKKHFENCTPESPCGQCERREAITCEHGTLYPETCGDCQQQDWDDGAYDRHVDNQLTNPI